jgi:hypothetical protein
LLLPLNLVVILVIGVVGVDVELAALCHIHADETIIALVFLLLLIIIVVVVESPYDNFIYLLQRR